MEVFCKFLTAERALFGADDMVLCNKNNSLKRTFYSYVYRPNLNSASCSDL